MAQVFHPSTNTLSKVTIFGAVFILLAGAALTEGIQRSPYSTLVNVIRQQPAPFSHEHHVSGLGIDCRYCHTSVLDSSFAGMPPTKTCMTCHSQIWADAEMLEPVRASWASGTPLSWTRVHVLPDYVYFDHSIHLEKGVGCSTCHGRVDQMPLLWKTQSLYMEWCLDCHSRPEKYLRPREEVFNMQWTSPPDQLALGQRLVGDYRIRKDQIINCSVCHR
jgi:hypothetical protein